MIITEKKPIENVLDFLKDAKKVVVLGCSECATACNTGGEPEVADMVKVLQENGKEVLGSKVLTTSCNYLLDKKELKELKAEIADADAVLSLACGDGVQTVAELVDFDVFPGNDTMYVGQTVRNGIFKEMCKTCGDCVLGRTAAICPVTQCGKGLMNGACGGSKNGMCEVNPDNKCAWIEIYKKLKDQGKEDLLEEIEPIRGYKASAHPRTLNLREKVKAEKAQEAAK